MPLKVENKCHICEKTDSQFWKTTDNGVLCFECSEKPIVSMAIKIEEPDSSNGESKNLRKSTRATRFKSKLNSNNSKQPKGRSRRAIFKKIPQKTPNIQNVTRTVQSVFYKGSYVQVGDIVSCIGDDQKTYYAQIHGLLVDVYNEKSAFLTWLIPTQASPPPCEKFDPSTYLVGFEEDFARKLSCVEFVMHAPSNYFHDKTNPFPGPDTNDFKGNYIWTTLKPVERPKTEGDGSNEDLSQGLKEDSTDIKPRMPMTRRRRRELSDSENSNEKDDENK